jgi:hypothetical protein
MVVAVAFCAAAGTAGDKPTPAGQLASMAWLAGDWEGRVWGGIFHAYYCTPQGGRIISYNTLRKDGAITYHEFEVFEVEGDKVVMRPFPRGKPATPLTLVTYDAQARRAVFENPDKDFPTRITYHRKSDDRLVITLSDPHNNSDQSEVSGLRRK